MLRSLQITLALLLGTTLAGCNRSPVQPAPAPSTNTSYKPVIDGVPPPQDTGVRVNADRGEVDIKVDRDRPGILRDRDVEIKREADGDINIKRERDLDNERRPLLNRDIDIKVNPGEGVKVDVDK